MLSQQAYRFILRHFLHICMSYVPNSVKKRMAYAFYHAKKIGRIVDPIHAVHMHLVKILDKDADAVLLGTRQNRHVKFAVESEGLLHTDPGQIPRMYNQIRNSPCAARFHTTDGVGDKLGIVGGQRLPHRRVGLNQANPAFLCRGGNLGVMSLRICPIDTTARAVVRPKVVVGLAEPRCTDMAQRFTLRLGIGEKIPGCGCKLHQNILPYVLHRMIIAQIQVPVKKLYISLDKM